ncbi:MAG TPA: class I SAM-dependent methyltransferase, partial [Pyrinomonadaceae bacterium]|nr:class I SAM-dependent methyltransferase [Pyrinomonadaceae bacterium]
MTQPAPGVTPDLFWETMTGFQKSAVLKSAVELEIFTKIGEGNSTAADIASACNASERGVRIICDSLVTMGFLTKSGTQYAMTDASAAFLDKRSQAYLGSALDFILSPQQRRGFDDLTNAVKNGGSSITGDASMDPESQMWVTFARAMAPLMFPMAQMTAEHLDLDTTSEIKILDIAAGHGIFGIMAGQKYPNAQIYGADWANVLTVAQENAAKFGMSDRYHTIPGNAFESDFGTGFDAILVPNFFHHFDVETCENFIRKLDGSLAEGGKIATVEFIPNDDRISPPAAAMFAVVMLAATPAGDA